MILLTDESDIREGLLMAITLGMNEH
jgi:hypothetical protein